MTRFLLLFASLLFGTLPAVAAPNDYDVEVLVFQQDLPELEGGELWTFDPEAVPAPPNLAETIAPPGTAAPADLALRPAADALVNTGQYRVLAHHRWRQRAEERSATKPIRLQDAAGQLDGTFMFYMSRFLHVQMDLTLRDPALPDTPIFRLHEQRRIKSQEISYFDHPKFGVLVKITPVDKN